MKRILGFSSLFLTIFCVGNYPSKAASELTPYQTVVLASAINYCSVEYGLITQKEAYSLIIKIVQDDHDLEPYQIYNLMQKKAFAKDADKLVDSLGGCKRIASKIKASIDRKPTGFKGLTDGKKDYEYLYKLDF